MFNILSHKEAEAWCQKNLYEADAFLFPVSVAIKFKRLIRIDSDAFFVSEQEYLGCKWQIDEVKRLSKQEMQEQNLQYKYFVKAHVKDKPVGYHGITTVSAYFNLD